MFKIIIEELFTHHKGKILGIFIGLLFSILVITMGLLKTVFIFVCIYIGYLVGKRLDDSESFYNLLDDFFKKTY